MKSKSLVLSSVMVSIFFAGCGENGSFMQSQAIKSNNNVQNKEKPGNPIQSIEDLRAGTRGIYIASPTRLYLDGVRDQGIYEISFDGKVNRDFKPPASFPSYQSFISEVVLPLSTRPGKVLLGIFGLYSDVIAFSKETGFQEKYYVPSGFQGAVENPTNGDMYIWGNCLPVGTLSSPIFKVSSGGASSAFKPPFLQGSTSSSNQGCQSVESVFMDSQDASKIYVLGNVVTKSYLLAPGVPVQDWGYSKMLRLNTSDGSIDPAFNSNFSTITPFGMNGHHHNRTVLQDPKTGKIYAGNINFTQTLYGTPEALVRLNTDGSRDTSFQLSQKAKPWIRWRQIRDMAFDSSGRLYVASGCGHDANQICIVALTPTGDLDSGFTPEALFLDGGIYDTLIAVDKYDTLYVASRLPHPKGGRVPLLGFDATGKLRYTFDELRVADPL